MLTLFILIFIGTGFYVGYQRGLALQLVYTGGYFISFLAAKANYLSLGRKLTLLIPYPAPTEETKLVFFNKNLVFEMDKAFYAAFAFVAILFIGWAVTRFIGIFFYKLSFTALLSRDNDLFGGILNTIIVIIGLTIFLTMMAMIPIPYIQQLFQKSGPARLLVEHTPIISKQLTHWWITKTIM
ncbi:CvpA family protein [Vagococcus vulneris]|uniref:Colicin V production protein CvpA n=1 Tax=Vagococcus vulneris TaxID=1977869 RepID=A0A429ZWI3_9ENTE|nr:CvpA family protein [Vagococcus vulneris]RST98119.1 hypothetical protein CBF37_08785 [Vagococcus vulneris]